MYPRVAGTTDSNGYNQNNDNISSNRVSVAGAYGTGGGNSAMSGFAVPNTKLGIGAIYNTTMQPLSSSSSSSLGASQTDYQPRVDRMDRKTIAIVNKIISKQQALGPYTSQQSLAGHNPSTGTNAYAARRPVSAMSGMNRTVVRRSPSAEPGPRIAMVASQMTPIDSSVRVSKRPSSAQRMPNPLLQSPTLPQQQNNSDNANTVVQYQQPLPLGAPPANSALSVRDRRVPSMQPQVQQLSSTIQLAGQQAQLQYTPTSSRTSQKTSEHDERKHVGHHADPQSDVQSDLHPQQLQSQFEQLDTPKMRRPDGSPSSSHDDAILSSDSDGSEYSCKQVAVPNGLLGSLTMTAQQRSSFSNDDTGGDNSVPVLQRSRDERRKNPERLNLDKRKLTACPVLYGEENLKLLNFQNNLIKEINNLKNLPNLIFLDLYNNKIKKVMNLESVPTLRVLMLGKNEIERIENLEPLKKLDVLDLHSNLIEKIENLDHLKELRVLNLAGNRIRVVENVAGLSSATEINFRRNKIEKVYELNLLPSLQRVFLSNNCIRTFDSMECIFGMNAIMELSLDGNQISADPVYRQYLLQRLPTLRHLDLKPITDDERRQSTTVAVMKEKQQMKWDKEKRDRKENIRTKIETDGSDYSSTTSTTDESLSPSAQSELTATPAVPIITPQGYDQPPQPQPAAATTTAKARAPPQLSSADIPPALAAATTASTNSTSNNNSNSNSNKRRKSIEISSGGGGGDGGGVDFVSSTADHPTNTSPPTSAASTRGTTPPFSASSSSSSSSLNKRPAIELEGDQLRIHGNDIDPQALEKYSASATTAETIKCLELRNINFDYIFGRFGATTSTTTATATPSSTILAKIQRFTNLSTLKLYNNNICDLFQLDALSLLVSGGNIQLRNLVIQDNPVCENEHLLRPYCISLCNLRLETFNGVTVGNSEHEESKTLFGRFQTAATIVGTLNPSSAVSSTKGGLLSTTTTSTSTGAGAKRTATTTTTTTTNTTSPRASLSAAATYMGPIIQHAITVDAKIRLLNDQWDNVLHKLIYDLLVGYDNVDENDDI